MSCWNKEELENMLEDVVNELDLSNYVIEKHGPNGTAPAELVRLVLAEKDLRIKALKSGMIEINCSDSGVTACCLGPDHNCMLNVNDGYCAALSCQYQVQEK